MASIGDSLKLNEIFEKATNNIISLPTVQRGFVWKAYQIENLWDSLLRGYPIGSFVLTQKFDSFDKYELLDGQQRASAICLGFYNPLNTGSNNTIFKTSYENIMIFIDLGKPNSINDNRKYIFRVITKSHPWGYRRQENQKILESKSITEAMCSYNISEYDYIHKDLKEFWPYDSYNPIPLGFFIDALNIEDLNNSIQEWKKRLKINDGKRLKVIDKRSDGEYTIEEIFWNVKRMINEQKIPLLYLSKLFDDEENNLKVIPNTNDNIEINDEFENDNNIAYEKSEDRNISEIENLFIRLNSGGTPLRGEELNYSILKAHIDLSLQLEIEKICKGLFYPARFITIVFRLFNNIDQENIDENESIRMNIKPKQFQRMMSDKRKGYDFIKFLKENFIDSNTTINKTKEILLYNIKSNEIGLPTFIAYSLADKAPEIMFMLLYRLLIKKDNITSDIKPRVLGIITLFTWLNGWKQKDHSKILYNIWPCIKNFRTEIFWSNETVQRAKLRDDEYEVITDFPNLARLKKIIPEKAKITSLTWEKICSNYGNFINKMFFNKDLILYAQRKAMSEWFHEIEDCNLEDTNRAFDWDHICPSNYIHNKRNIRSALKDWYNSNGNIRAWKYSLNRSDQDNSPLSKLNPEKADLDWWSKHLSKNYLTERQLRDDLLEMSVCDKEWLKLNSDINANIKDSNTARQIIYCILNRNINICLEWYNQFKIYKLIPESMKRKDIMVLFENIINLKMWKRQKDEEENDRYKYVLYIGENMYLYFSFNIEFNTLKEDKIYFGIYEVNSNEFIEKIKIPKEKENKYIITNSKIETKFTLNSYSNDSKIFLFNEFYLWLNEFPDKKIKKIALEKFNNSIKSDIKSTVIKIIL